jgi:hypothetical protein
MTAKTTRSKNTKPTRAGANSAKAKKKKPAEPSRTKEKLTALGAAARVLAETQEPMSCPELIAAMAAKRYRSSPTGKTPQATLSAAIQREIELKKNQSRLKKRPRLDGLRSPKSIPPSLSIRIQEASRGGGLSFFVHARRQNCTNVIVT